MLTKAELTELYLINNISACEIAKMYNKHIHTIFRWLKKHNIRKLKDLQHITHLTNKQIEIINGSMLGDGFCSKNSKTPKANWCYGNVQAKKPNGNVQGKPRLGELPLPSARSRSQRGSGFGFH